MFVEMAGGIRIVLYLIAAYAVFTAAIYLAQRRMMYFPATYLPSPIDAGLAEAQAVTLKTSDGLDLVAWHVPVSPSGGLPTIVYLHGNAGNIAGRVFRARPFAKAGYGVLLVEYRGYGGNPGSPTEEGLYADGRAALAYLAEQGIGPERIVLFGESLGSGVAVRMASEIPAHALVLEAPFTSATDVAADVYWFLPVRRLLKDHFDSLSRIGDIDAPLLIIHGEHDRTVPTKLGRRLLAAAREPRTGVFIPNAGHNDLPAHGSDRIVLDFLNSLD